ncbi:MAG: NAD(+)/NADH kinase [Clostridia bacterium]|nr:NAD(+)/NADH kinase [Clostridia bacterium]
MKLAIFTKSNNAEGQKKKNELAIFLNEKKIDCMTFDTLDCDNLSCENKQVLIKNLKECRAIIVFGGDGTVLRAVSWASIVDIPILSVNLGDMGFLAELERTASPEEILDAVKTYQIETRNLIEVTYGDNKKIIALNDVVLKSKGTTPIYVSAKIDGEALDRYRSDGVIVSTPTGSTAYSLSAGGPVLAPDLEAMVVIPICPHTLHSKPVVLSIESAVELILEKENESANLIVDGRLVTILCGQTKITILKSIHTAAFLRKENKGFYKRLLQKMNIWGVSNS